MQIRVVAAALGALAGLLWILAAVLGWGEDPVAADARAVSLVGLAVLLVASGLWGYTLAPNAPLWLRAVVVAGTASLVAAVLGILLPQYDAAAGVLLAAGLVVTVGGATLVVTHRPETPRGRRRMAV